MKHNNIFEFIQSLFMLVGSVVLSDIQMMAGIFAFSATGIYHLIKAYKEFKTK